MKPPWLSAALGATLVLLGGCSGATAPAPTGTTVGVPAVSTAAPPDGLLWVATSPEYRAAFRQTYRLAGELVAERSVGRSPGTWAVVLDVDETVMSNLQYQLERHRVGKGFDSASWTAWCQRQEATILPGVLPFLGTVRDLGGHIALVTNRDDDVHADTAANLEALQVPFDILLTQSEEREKTGRFQSVTEGTADPRFGPLEVLLFLGDNIHDFPPPRSSNEFGQRFLVLPNPMYGSWEDNPLP